MKTLLTLLILIPSLSWGEYLNLKDVPTSKKELNYLFGFNIGDEFDKNLFTVQGKIKDREPYEDENYPYKTFNIYPPSDSEEEDEFESKIFNQDFKSFHVVLDKEYKIVGLKLKQEFKNEKLTSQLSGLMETFDLEIFKNYGGLSEISFSNCADFASKVIKAYKFKRKIDDKFLTRYFYTPYKASGEIEEFKTYSILKDKEGRVTISRCDYYIWPDWDINFNKIRPLNSYFSFDIYSPEYFEIFSSIRNNSPNEYYDIYEVEKKEFEEILKLATDIDITGL